MSRTEEYERIVGPIEDRMVRTVWRILRNRHDAEDAFQEAVACIWQRWERLCRHPNPRALVLRICINSAYDVLRERSRSRAESLEDREQLTKSADMAPDRRLILDEDCARVLAAIGQLPRAQAAAVFLKLVEERPHAEIAAILGCSEATARTHFKRGSRRLRARLESNVKS